MAELPQCPLGVTCPGTDFPIANFSSEADDGLTFIGLAWPGGGSGTPSSWGGGGPGTVPGGGGFPSKGGGGGGIWPQGITPPGTGYQGGEPPIGGGPTIMDLPPLESIWYSQGCFATCFSFVSQEAADTCAAIQAILCQGATNTADNQGATINGRPVQQFLNETQYCQWDCGNGTFNIYTVNAGVFIGASQEEANRKAYSFACNMVHKNRLCLDASDINTSVCVNEVMSECILVTQGNHGPFKFSVTSGNLPPGTAFSEAGCLSGTPSAAGTYSFTATCTDGIGQTQSALCTVGVFGLQSATLPPGTAGAAYGPEQLVALGGSGSVNFTASGLPSGFTLSSSGVLTSDATIVAGNYNFTVTMSDADGNTCDQEVILVVATGCRSTLGPAPVASVGFLYSYNIVPGFGTGPWMFIAGGLPGGLGITCGLFTGLLAGTPLYATSITLNMLIVDIPSGDSSVCPLLLTVTDPCAAIATNIQDVVWVNTHPPSACKDGSIVAGVSNDWFIHKNNIPADPCAAGDTNLRWQGQICNGGPAYNITVSCPYVSSGACLLPGCGIELRVNINADPYVSAFGSFATDTPNPLQVTVAIPANSTSTITINLWSLGAAGPAWPPGGFLNVDPTGPMTITPLLHP